MPTLVSDTTPIVHKPEPNTGSTQATLQQIKGANFFLRTALDQVTDGILILQGENACGFGPRILFNNTPMASLVGADPVKGLRERFITQFVATQSEADDLVRVLQTAAKSGSAEWEGGLKTFYQARVVPCLWRIRAVQNNHGLLMNYTVTVCPKEGVIKTAASDMVTGVADADSSLRLRNENLAFAARGMAHDVNNILGIIGVRVSEAALIMPPATEVGALLEEALSAVKRAQSLTTGVLQLSKDIPARIEPVDMQNIIRETTSVVRSGTAVRIEVLAEPGLWAAVADSSRIGQVLQNLIINGIQAMKGEGRMEVIARNTHFPQGDMKLAPGRYVEITVRDRGAGMPPETVSRLFNESFTTKQRGNGVGLMTCKRIVEDHGGDIRVSSMIGTGTEFTFFLPATHLAPARTESRAPQKLISGIGSILLVDDEPDLLIATVAVLKRCGYRVFAAHNGEEGVRIYQQLARANDPADVVIMDLTLAGGLSGEEAMREIRAFDPRAKVIASSGGLVDQMRQEHVAMGFVEVLPKPYVASMLSQVVHRVLSSGRHGSAIAA
ncbi:MAG: ATP-binding protein [Verrucomicrobiaceae bacterium]